MKNMKGMLKMGSQVSEDPLKKFQELVKRKEAVKADLIKSQTVRDTKKKEYDSLLAELGKLGVPEDKVNSYLETAEKEIASLMKAIEEQLNAITAKGSQEDNTLDLNF